MQLVARINRQSACRIPPLTSDLLGYTPENLPYRPNLVHVASRAHTICAGLRKLRRKLSFLGRSKHLLGPRCYSEMNRPYFTCYKQHESVPPGNVGQPTWRAIGPRSPLAPFREESGSCRGRSQPLDGQAVGRWLDQIGSARRRKSGLEWPLQRHPRRN